MSDSTVEPRVTVWNFLFDDRFGGPQKRVIDVAVGLRRLGVDTLLVLPDRGGNAAEVASASGVPVLRVPQTRIPNPRKVGQLASWAGFFWRDVARIARLLRRHRPTAVHVNGAVYLTPALAAWITRTPLIWHLNDTTVPPRVARFLGGMVIRLADVVVVAAEAVALHYGVGGHPHMLIYAPVDIERFLPAPARPARETFRIGLVGNYNPLKGHEYLLRAVALLKSSVKRDVKAVLAGARLTSHTRYSAGIDAIIETEGISDLVEQHGFVTDVAALLSTLDVLVLSSTAEACPIVVLEAMSAGLPVVAADVGGVRELLLERDPSPAGIVVPPRHPQALADALSDLASSPERATLLGRNGRVRAERYFSLSICVALHAEAYRAARRARYQRRERSVEGAKPAHSLGN